MKNRPLASSGNNTADVLLMAAWFGLVTGLAEGALFLVLQQIHSTTGVSLEILWISPLVDLLLFGLLGVALALSARFFPWLLPIRLAVFLFSFLAILDVLAVVLFEHLYPYAIIILALGLATQLTYWLKRHEDTVLRFWRKSLPWVAAAVLLGFTGTQIGSWLQERIAVARLPQAAPGSPNVLLIVLDTLRADHLSSYGYARPTSPNLDRIAKEGVLFEHAYATSSWTLPSHASIFTGRYPYQHGVEWNTARALVSASYPTLAETLRSRGYRTGAFSGNVFWVTRDRLGRGFIRFEDYFHSLGDGFFRTLYGRALERIVLRRLGYKDIPARKRATDINASFLRWVRQDQERPFFAFLNYIDTHDPYLPPQPYRGKFSRRDNPGGALNWRLGRNDPKLSPNQLRDEIDAYDGAIAYLDHHIGQLLSELQKSGLDTNTLLIITSDHGESLGERGHFLHANTLYPEEIRVPLLFRQPGRVPADTRVAQPVTIASIPATIMNLLRADNETPFPERSVAPLWESQGANIDTGYVLAEIGHIPWAPKNAPSHQGWIKSIIDSHWQFLADEKGNVELYNRGNDPLERHNLAKTVDVKTVMTRFQRQLLPALTSKSTR